MVTNESIISYAEATTKVAAAIQEKDKKIEELFSSIESILEPLESNESSQVKYNKVLEVEFLFVRARILVEFEHIKVKSILNNSNTPASVRGIFLRRDQYLAQVALKLNSIRDDISVLQKSYYTTSLNRFK